MSSYFDRTSLVNKGFIIWPKRELIHYLCVFPIQTFFCFCPFCLSWSQIFCPIKVASCWQNVFKNKQNFVWCGQGLKQKDIWTGAFSCQHHHHGSPSWVMETSSVTPKVRTQPKVRCTDASTLKAPYRSTWFSSPFFENFECPHGRQFSRRCDL